MSKVLAVGILALCAVVSYLVGGATNGSAPAESDANAGSALPSALAKSRLPRLRALLGARPTEDRLLAIQNAVLTMGARELSALWDSSHASFNYYENDDRAVASAILERLGELDPELALSKIADTNTGKYKLLPSVLRGWARADLDGALVWIREQPDHRARVSCMRSALDLVGITDRDAAIDLFVTAVKDRTIGTHDWNVDRFFERWGREDAETAMAKAVEFRAATDNPDAILGVIDAWSRTDPKAAVAWIDKHADKEIQHFAVVRMAREWGRVDPVAAAEFVLGRRGEDSDYSLMGQVLGQWVDTDLAAAVEWVEAIADPEQRAEIQKMLIDHARGSDDHETALDFALKSLMGNPGNRHMQEAVAKHAWWQLAQNDPQAAFVWAEEHLTDPDLRQDFDRHILREWIWRQPDEAARRLGDFATANEGTYTHAARSWARSDLEASRAWLDELPAGENRDAAMLGVAEGWLSKDRAAAGEWIGGFPAGETRDQLVGRQARATMDVKDIQNSIDIASGISDPFLRDKTYEGILKTWIRDEIKANDARAFIESTDLISETVRWRVLNRPHGHP